MAEEIPVYLFTGFMDSGKTSLIKDTIFENDFANGSKGLSLCARMVMWSMIWIAKGCQYPGCRD